MNSLVRASKTRVFDWKAQCDFTLFSGDRNPIHTDPVAARRTQAGQPVVHGMHAVLWALEVLAQNKSLQQPFAQIKVRFQKFIYVGDVVTVETLSQDAGEIRLQLCIGGLVVTTLHLTFRETAPGVTEEPISDNLRSDSWAEKPAELSLEQMKQSRGWLSFAKSLGTTPQSFPALSTAIGARRVASLACMSHLVGMVCPGLHSIFSAFSLNVIEEVPLQCAIYFQVTNVDDRFGLIEQSVAGGGWSGAIEGFARVRPVAQPTMEALAGLVGKDEFRGSRALIIGGSRGLGEITAKIIAAGGGTVTITYTVGLAEAQAIQMQIRDCGGACEILRYDATQPAADQLQQLKVPPASLYYFATPFISRRKTDLYVQSVFDRFVSVYVDGFYNLLQQLLYTPGTRLSAFYPSSVFVEDPPAEMTEYVMAKAAGEALCISLARFRKQLRVVVKRLPRLLTDQTASAIPLRTAPSLDVILPIVRHVEIVGRLTGI